MAAISQNWRALRFASLELKLDREFVMEADCNSGTSSVSSSSSGTLG